MKDTTTLDVGRQALSALASKLLMAVIGFGGTVVFARLLGPDGLGVYKTAIAAAFLLTQVSGGVGNAVKKRVSEVDVDPGEYLGAGLIVHLLLTTVVTAGILVLIDPAASYFGSREMALGVAFVVASLGLFNVVNRLYAGLGHPARSTWVDLVRSVLTLACQLLLLRIGLEAFGLVLGLTLGTFGGAVISWWLADVRPAVPSVRTRKRLGQFARYSVPVALVATTYASTDALILAGVASSAAVGLYTSANQLMMPASMLASSIGDALVVKTSGVSSVGDPVRQDLINATAYAGLFAIPMFFGAVAMRRELLRTIFGPEFAAASLALVGMAVFQIGNVYSKPFSSTLSGTDRPNYVLGVNVLVVVVHVPLAIGLGLRHGLEGVVAATAAVEIGRLFTYQFLAARHLGGPVLPRPVAGQVVSGAVMFVLLLGLLEVVPIAGWIHLLAVVGAGAAVYFAVLLGVSSHFRDTVLRVVGH